MTQSKQKQQKQNEKQVDKPSDSDVKNKEIHYHLYQPSPPPPVLSYWYKFLMLITGFSALVLNSPACAWLTILCFIGCALNQPPPTGARYWLYNFAFPLLVLLLTYHMTPETNPIRQFLGLEEENIPFEF